MKDHFMTDRILTSTKTVEGEAILGMAIRLLFLGTHYRKPLNYTEDKLQENMRTWLKWYSKAERMDEDIDVEFLEALCDDMNTAKAICVMHKYYARKDYGRLHAAMNFLGLLPNSMIKNIRDLEQKMLIEDLRNGPNLLSI